MSGVKRVIDLVGAAFGLLVLSPVLLVVAVLIELEDRGPIFYKGVRVGRDGKPFRMVKFRTMVVNADRLGGLSTADDDPRITRIGKRLRSLKLDELPQLFNVVRGNMSLVGPRPEVPQEVARYTEEERELLSVRPGITDWASVRFRDEGAILKGSTDPHETYLRVIRPEKMRLGLEYVRDRSLETDMRILAATLKALVSPRSR
jgi:lipopolysaccharide/colanic/teichoic acid biosynthesis glycosyltransferase